MDVLLIVIAAVLFALPTAAWFAVRARRAHLNRPAAELAPPTRYGADGAPAREPKLLGRAWARTTTFID